MNTPATSFDPVLLAVLSNRFENIVREMTNTLLRSGRSAVLNTARDFSCSIITAENELLASAEGLPVHVIGTEFLAEAMTEIHHEGEHMFTACAKSHQADCGNALPTTYMPAARDVYEEGALIFPCVQVQRGRRDVEDIIRMCRRRIRVPDQWYGDYLATLGSALIAEWFDYSERRMVEAIGQLPAGELVGSATHDPYPGVPDGVPLTVKVAIDPEAGMIELDLRENPDNYPGGLNESRACATNNVMTGAGAGMASSTEKAAAIAEIERYTDARIVVVRSRATLILIVGGIDAGGFHHVDRLPVEASAGGAGAEAPGAHCAAGAA